MSWNESKIISNLGLKKKKGVKSVKSGKAKQGGNKVISGTLHTLQSHA